MASFRNRVKQIATSSQAVLTQAFPGTEFVIAPECDGHHGWIDVTWSDDPPYDSVKEAIAKSRIDWTGDFGAPHYDWLLAEGGSIWAGTDLKRLRNSAPPPGRRLFHEGCIREPWRYKPTEPDHSLSTEDGRRLCRFCFFFFDDVIEAHLISPLRPFLFIR